MEHRGRIWNAAQQFGPPSSGDPLGWQAFKGYGAGTVWRRLARFQRDRADECAIAKAAGLTLVAYARPETMQLREYDIYRKLEHTE